MNRKSLFAVATLAAIAGTLAFAQPEKKAAQPDKKPPAAGQPQLPPGMTEDDMKAYMAAATPGKQHEHMLKSVGVWEGKCKSWPTPGAEVMASECISTVTSFMDGKFIKCEIKGDMPGMGPYTGFGINGFDNVSQKYQSAWVDNMGTGMMTGIGELSPDGKTLEWKYSYNCPITRKCMTMRQVEHYTSADTMTFEMFGAEPHSGKEYKMMEIAFTRKAAAVGQAK